MRFPGLPRHLKSSFSPVHKEELISLLLESQVDRAEYKPTRYKMRTVFGAISSIGLSIWFLFYLFSSLTRPDVLAAPFQRSTSTNQRPLSQWLMSANQLASDNGTPYIFQVGSPIPSSYGEPVATQKVVSHVFGNSYGHPYVGNYTPPNEKFNHVALTLNASVGGNQFDRLAHFFLGNVEVWRPSTGEPGGRDVDFGFVKDVSPYASLFQSPQQLSFLLNNVVDDTYTGYITVNITASFYYVTPDNLPKGDVEASYSISRSADKIVPMQPKDASPGHVWDFPNDNVEVKIGPVNKNTTRAVVDVYASGNSNEEFWYSHLLDNYTTDFPGNGGKGPTRVVEVYLDDKFAGFAYPYHVIYTGGISPDLWSPLVGVNAYEVPSYQVDVTPFLSYLYDGGATIKIKAINGLENEDSSDASTSVENDWLITGSVMTWELADVEGSAAEPHYSHSPKHSEKGFTSGDKNKLVEIVTTEKTSESSAMLTFNGKSFEYKWNQNGQQSNIQTLVRNTSSQQVAHSSTGSNYATVNGKKFGQFDFAYGLGLTSVQIGDDNNYGMNTTIAQAYDVSDSKTYDIKTGQIGSSYASTAGGKFKGGEATTEQWYYSSIDDEEYTRHVKVKSGKIEFDDYSPDGTGSQDPEHSEWPQDIEDSADKLLNAADLSDASEQASELYAKIVGPQPQGYTLMNENLALNNVSSSSGAIYLVRPLGDESSGSS